MMYVVLRIYIAFNFMTPQNSQFKVGIWAETNKILQYTRKLNDLFRSQKKISSSLLNWTHRKCEREKISPLDWSIDRETFFDRRWLLHLAQCKNNKAPYKGSNNNAILWPELLLPSSLSLWYQSRYLPLPPSATENQNYFFPKCIVSMHCQFQPQIMLRCPRILIPPAEN